MSDIRASQNRLGESGAYGSHHGEDDGGEEIITDGPGARRNRFRSAEQQATRKAERSRYQVDATASDDELEDEIDDNLDEIGEAAARLKKLGMAMGSELDSQNVRLERIDGKVGRLDMKITHNTERVSANDLHMRD
jgi:dynactin complex subunit